LQPGWLLVGLLDTKRKSTSATPAAILLHLCGRSLKYDISPMMLCAWARDIFREQMVDGGYAKNKSNERLPVASVLTLFMMIEKSDIA
jgi:hypothetical protein